MSKKELASWQSDLAAAAKAIAKNEGTDSSAITIQHGTMMYHEQAIPNNELEVIVVASTAENCYYSGAYDPDKISSPECFAQSLDPKSMAPHSNVAEPIAENCQVCPYNEFGSKGKGKMCKNYRKLIMIPAGTTADEVAGAELAYLKVSPTSVNNWKKYCQQLVASAGIPPWAAKTKIKVVPDKKTIHQVTFHAVEPVGDDALLAAIHGRIEEGESQLLQPYTYEEDEVAESSKY
jgi:hypothetical protein